MRIFASADIHGKEGRITDLENLVKNYQPDLLLLAGDITGIFSKKRTLKRIGSLPVPVFAVRGNSEIFLDDNDLTDHKIHSLHLAFVKKDGFRFSGISGTIPLPFNSRLAFKESELKKKLAALIDRNTILLVHPPPRGIRDKVLDIAHAGSRLVRKLVDQYQPLMLICGHIHENAGITIRENTMIVNCSMYREIKGVLIDLERPGLTPKACILKG